MTIKGDIFMTDLSYQLIYYHIRDLFTVVDNEMLNSFCLGHLFCKISCLFMKLVRSKPASSSIFLCIYPIPHSFHLNIHLPQMG
jgi:hypothetical protein